MLEFVMHPWHITVLFLAAIQVPVPTPLHFPIRLEEHDKKSEVAT